jgi:REP element-mobilizing transposase RayT
MPRPPRIHFPGALFHVIARGNGRQKTFRDQADYRAFLAMLASLKQQKPFQLYAYCLMPNHFHLLLEVDRVPLAHLMQPLLTRYAKAFNGRHRRVGHLFQARYQAILCQRDTYLQALVRYLHLNPVRAHLIRDPAAWPWSSHRAYLGRQQGPLVDAGFPLSLFHPHRARSVVLYQRFVRDALGLGHEAIYYPPHTNPCLGDRAFVTRYQRLTALEPPVDRPPGPPVPLERLSAHPAVGIGVELLRSQSQARAITAARRAFTLRALTAGHRPSRIAAFLRCSPSAISKIVRRHLSSLATTSPD